MLHSSVQDIEQIIVGYFAGIFSTSNPFDFDAVIDLISIKVMTSMKANLERPSTKEDVEEALKQMKLGKAPSPNGMNLFFFQHYWETVGGDVCEKILTVWNGGPMAKGFNHTYVTLIPKKHKPMEVSDFRPISLCNATYKFVTKVISNRLKELLPLVISDDQSPFTAGRLITDNVLIASKCFIRCTVIQE